MKDDKMIYVGSPHSKVWKPIALFLLGAILSLSLMIAREHIMLMDFVTKAEAKEMISIAPYPWNVDRKYVLEALTEIKSDVKDIKSAMWKRTDVK